MKAKSGPLAGVRVVEFAGIGPGPMCGMLLADMGAEVLLLERLEPADIGIPRSRQFELLHRGKLSIAVDLKNPEGLALAADLAATADVLVEGFRPGTMERLGLGPQECMVRHPGLVYGRMTGYGQDGPMHRVAGHDLNYIALSGALHAMGRAGQAPSAPLNLLGDYAGGGMTMAFGIACALAERSRSGRGQVIDASMVEGAALLMTSFYGLYAAGMHLAPRGENMLDGGAPFYEIYACSDGRHIAFAAIERKFRRVFAERAGLEPDALDGLDDPARWPEGKAMLARLFSTRTQDEWCALTADTDACVTPVLDHAQAASHLHNTQRRSFQGRGGVLQPSPAPRFSRTPGCIGGPPPARGEGGRALAVEWGLQADRLDRLEALGAVAPHHEHPAPQAADIGINELTMHLPNIPEPVNLPAWAAAALSVPSTSRFTDVDGSKIHFLAWGNTSRPPVVLVHGNAANAEWWRFVAPLLADDYYVIAPDLGGMGDSAHCGRYERERYAQQVLAVAHAASPSQRPILVGHSLGGYVTILAAGAAGDVVAGLVILDSPLREPKGAVAAPLIKPSSSRRSFSSEAEALARFRVLPEQPVGCAFYLDHIARQSITRTAEGWWWKFDPPSLAQPRPLDFTGHIAALRCDAALMWGALSQRFDGAARAWSRHFFAPYGPVVEIPNAGHHIMLDEPLALVAALRAQLANWQAKRRDDNRDI